MAKILVLDDHTEIADHFADVFRRYGHEAQSAYTPEGALAICAQTDFDFVFTDLNLGSAMNGIDFADALVGTGKTPRIILVTAERIYKDMVGKNISAILQKPVTEDELLNELK